MSLSLDKYRAKLINKILFAASQENVKRFINAAMKAFKQNNVNGYIVARFVDKMVVEIEQLNLMKTDSQQWLNIQVAKIQFISIRQQLNATAV